MRFARSTIILTLALAVFAGMEEAQTPPAGQPRGGGGRGRGPGQAQTMTLTTTAWADGGLIPLKYTQSGPEMSPGIQWSGAPPGIASYVLTFVDLDTVVNNSTDGLLHWMLWNIPGTAMAVAQGRPDGFELADGTRQISVSGARYRGPGAPAAGPLHHYVMELYALDIMLDVKVNPQGPQDANPNVQAIRSSIMQAMAGHIRAKAAYTGLFHRVT
jgi:Raf kinase inhibitor-like YbhB/YbcL family protein